MASICDPACCNYLCSSCYGKNSCSWLSNIFPCCNSSLLDDNEIADELDKRKSLGVSGEHSGFGQSQVQMEEHEGVVEGNNTSPRLSERATSGESFRGAGGGRQEVYDTDEQAYPSQREMDMRRVKSEAA